MEFGLIEKPTVERARTGSAGLALEFGKANPGKWFEFQRESVGAAQRLRAVGLITRSSVIKNETGEAIGVHLNCMYDPSSKEAIAAEERETAPRKVKKAKKEGEIITTKT